MPLGARDLRRGSQYPPATRNGGSVAKLKERVQLGHFVQFKMKHRISFLQVSKALCLHFLQNDIKSATEKLFPKQNHFGFSETIFSFLWTRLLANLTNGFGVPKAAFSFYYYFVYKPPFFAFSSPVPGLIL